MTVMPNFIARAKVATLCVEIRWRLDNVLFSSLGVSHPLYARALRRRHLLHSDEEVCVLYAMLGLAVNKNSSLPKTRRNRSVYSGPSRED